MSVSQLSLVIPAERGRLVAGLDLKVTWIRSAESAGFMIAEI